uniref:Uncharacterized protein n=1 Tax=Phaeodactylum tricornutum TaxID=2850 RepID=A0A8J9TBN1_PHATR
MNCVHELKFSWRVLRLRRRQPLSTAVMATARDRCRMLSAISDCPFSLQPCGKLTTNAAKVVTESRRERKNYLPAGPEDSTIKFALSLPNGTMNNDIAGFCRKAINILTKRGTQQCMIIAEQILVKLIEERKEVKVTLFNRVIRGWARTNTDEALFKARSLLERMWELQETQPNLYPPPNNGTYSSVLYVCGLSSHPDTRTVAQRLVQELEERLQPSYPSSAIYSQLIRVHSNQASTQYGAAMAAEDTLIHLSSLSTKGRPHPTTTSFNRVLKAWSTSQEGRGAERALEILEMMIQLEANHGVAHPDKYSFGTVAAAFARRGQPQRAEAIFRKAVAHFRAKNISRAEDRVDLTSCLNAALSAWAKSGCDEAATIAETLLRDGYSLTDMSNTAQAAIASGDSFSVVIRPDLATHMSYMEAQVRCGRMLQAHAHVVAMVEAAIGQAGPPPTTDTFNFVIHGWLRLSQGSGGKYVLSLLNSMINLSEQHGFPCAPNSGTFNMCIGLLCKENSLKEAFDVLIDGENRLTVDMFPYQVLINALVKTKKYEDTVTASTLLHRIEAGVKKGTFQWDPKSVGLYTAVISAMANFRSKESADLALQTLGHQKNLGVQPTSRAYTAVIFAFASLRNVKSGRVAFDLFREMQVLDSDPSNKLKLDRLVFAAILTSLRNARTKESAENACVVLSYMLDLHIHGRPDIEPDERCYDACLNALLNSRDAHCVERAARLIKTIVTRHHDGALSHLPSAAIIKSVSKACSRLQTATMHGFASELSALIKQKE